MAADKEMLLELRATDDGSAEVIRDNTEAISQMDDVAKQGGVTLGRFSRQQGITGEESRRTNLALMDMSRVIQDANYGIRGMANNIDPLLQSMRRAREVSGSWTQTLSNLATGIFSPTGLLTIGVSTTVSLLVAYGDDIAEFFGLFESGADKVDDAIDSIEDLKEELSFFESRSNVAFDLLDRAFPDEDGLEAQERRLNVMRQLRNQMLTELEAAQEREAELQEQIERFETIGPSGESILQNQGVIPIDSSFEEELLKRRNQLANVQDRINVLTRDEQEARNEIFEAQVSYNQQVQFQRSEMGRSLQQQAEAADQRERAEEAAQERMESEKAAAADLAEAKRELLEIDRERAIAASEIVEAEINVGLGGQGQVPLSEMAGATENQRQALMRYNEELARSNDLTAEHADKMLYQYQSAEQLNTMVNQLTTAGFQQMGVILGDIMSTDFEGGVFQRFQLVFSDFLSRFGDQMIALGTAKLGLDNLFKAGPAGAIMAIAGGVALKAAAQATRNDAQKRLSNLSGGTGSTGNVLAGYRGFDVSGDQTEGQGRQDRTRGSDSAFLGTLRITDGFGKMVMEGQAEIDRSGGSNYLRGD